MKILQINVIKKYMCINLDLTDPSILQNILTKSGVANHLFNPNLKVPYPN